MGWAFWVFWDLWVIWESRGNRGLKDLKDLKDLKASIALIALITPITLIFLIFLIFLIVLIPRPLLASIPQKKAPRLGAFSYWSVAEGYSATAGSIMSFNTSPLSNTLAAMALTFSAESEPMIAS